MITLGFDLIFWIVQKKRQGCAAEHNGVLAAGLMADFAADMVTFILLAFVVIKRG